MRWTNVEVAVDGEDGVNSPIDKDKIWYKRRVVQCVIEDLAWWREMWEWVVAMMNLFFLFLSGIWVE